MQQFYGQCCTISHEFNSPTVSFSLVNACDWLGQFVGSYTASGTNQELGGCGGNMDNAKLAHSLDMGVFCISPNDKGGKLYKPSKVCDDAVVGSRRACCLLRG